MVGYLANTPRLSGNTQRVVIVQRIGRGRGQLCFTGFQLSSLPLACIGDAASKRKR